MVRVEVGGAYEMRLGVPELETGEADDAESRVVHAGRAIEGHGPGGRRFRLCEKSVGRPGHLRVEHHPQGEPGYTGPRGGVGGIQGDRVLTRPQGPPGGPVAAQ